MKMNIHNEETEESREFHIPFGGWYLKYFTDRVTILTGVGRSGTSLLGRILGSMRPSYYHFEPNLPKFCIAIPDMLRCLFYEDHQLPQVQGRNLNIDPATESWSGHYIREWEIQSRWNLKRRLSVFDYLKNENAQIYIKLTEFQGMQDVASEAFPGVKFIHIIRNGNDVIGSSLRPGWYNDLYMAANVVDWVETRKDKDNTYYNIPYFVSCGDPEAADYWKESNHVTRCAIAWRCCTRDHYEPKDNYRIIRYEDLVKYPDAQVENLRIWLGENRADQGTTGLTEKHIESIKAHKLSEYPDFTDQIEEPERGKFIALMEELKYR